MHHPVKTFSCLPIKKGRSDRGAALFSYDLSICQLGIIATCLSRSWFHFTQSSASALGSKSSGFEGNALGRDADLLHGLDDSSPLFHRHFMIRAAAPHAVRPPGEGGSHCRSASWAIFRRICNVDRPVIDLDQGALVLFHVHPVDGTPYAGNGIRCLTSTDESGVISFFTVAQSLPTERFTLTFFSSVCLLKDTSFIFR